MSYYVPTVIENTGRGERAMDLQPSFERPHHFHRHADRRWRGQRGHCPDAFLQMEDPKKDIQLYINSPAAS